MTAPLIFDCDGTLVASEAIYARTDARVLGRYGLPMSANEIRTTYMGVPVRDMLRNMEQRFGICFPENILSVLDSEVQKILDTDLEPIPGITEALLLLRARGHKMAVATNSDIARTTRNLATTALTDFFGAHLATVDQVAHGKPAPDVYVLAAQKLGADPRACIAIEDSAVGMRAAIAAGMVGIGYAPADHGPLSHADLLEAGAHLIIDSMADLPNAVETAEELRALI